MVAFVALTGVVAAASVYGYFFYGWRLYPKGVHDAMRQALRCMAKGEWFQAEMWIKDAIALTEQVRFLVLFLSFPFFISLSLCETGL